MSVTVRLGERDILLAPPASYAMRYDVVLAETRNRQRALCAALGACWQSTGAPGGRYDYDVMRFGGAVFDDLIGRGLRARDVYAAGARAMLLMQDGLFAEAEVAEAAGNSGAGADPAP